jgi:hypothetical protein
MQYDFHLDHSKHCHPPRFDRLFKAISVNLDPSLVNTPPTGQYQLNIKYSSSLSSIIRFVSVYITVQMGFAI